MQPESLENLRGGIMHECNQLASEMLTKNRLKSTTTAEANPECLLV